VTASPVLSRRSILLGLTAAAVASGVAGCTSSPRAGDPLRPTGATTPSSPAEQPGSAARTGGGGVLLAYFSRAGENYYYGGRRRLEVGNTEVLAGMIGRLVGCDVHRIEAADPYSDDYDETVRRNVQEQRADARPGIANPIPSLDRYDTVLLASPIWNVRAPMIMTTLNRSPRLHRQDSPPGCHVRSERARHDRAGLRRQLSRRHPRRRPRRAG
jgi:flavodoxin